MQTRSDIELELQQRLMTANNSGVVPGTRLTSLVQDATLWAGALYFWPSLQRLRQTTVTTKNILGLNYDIYDYPPDFLTDSISRLYIDGVKYFPKAYQDFLDYVDSSINPQLAPNPQNHFYTVYGRQFFTFPTYSGAGAANNLNVWGNIQHPALTSPSSPTIFTLWEDSGNEAILKKAMAVALKRTDTGVANAAEQEAIGLLQVIWKRVTDGMQKMQRLDHPKFVVLDYFGFGSGLSSIGNFNLPTDIVNNY